MRFFCVSKLNQIVKGSEKNQMRLMGLQA